MKRFIKIDFVDSHIQRERLARELSEIEFDESRGRGFYDSFTLITFSTQKSVFSVQSTKVEKFTQTFTPHQNRP